MTVLFGTMTVGICAKGLDVNIKDVLNWKNKNWLAIVLLVLM
jgi:hypothetical protein